MKNLTIHHLSFLILLIFFASCSPRTIYYSPGAMSNVGLEERNDLKASVNIVVPTLEEDRDNTSGIKELDLELAWSPVKHVGLYYKTYGYSEFHRKNYYSYNWFGPSLSHSTSFTLDQRMDEYGIGVYQTLGDLFHIEGYTYYGKGRMNMTESSTQFLNYDIKKKGFRIAGTLLLPRSNIQPKDLFHRLEMGLSYAVSNFKFDNIKTNFQDVNRNEARPLLENPSQGMTQFAFYGKMVFRYVSLKMEMGLHKSITVPGFSQNEQYSSFGLILDIDNMIRQNKRKG